MPARYPYIATEIDSYYHPRFATALFLETGFGYRVTLGKSAFLDARIGVGYLHGFFGGPVYDAKGGRLPNYGLPNAMPLFELGSGFNLRSDGPLRLSPFLRLVAFGRYPFNGMILPRVALELGTNLRKVEPVKSEGR